jgi:hypothetical protein
MRENLRGLAWLGACIFAWSELQQIYLAAESTIEPKLFAAGHEERWWCVVFLYWVVDTAVFLSFVYMIRRFGFRKWLWVPFWQIGLDLGLLLFLVHLVWLSTDLHVYASLASIGLSGLWQFLIAVGTMWGIASLLRFHALRRTYEPGRLAHQTPALGSLSFRAFGPRNSMKMAPS